MFGHWLTSQWGMWWWSSDKGNGPEAIQEIIVVGIVTSIFVPRIRRWWIAREQHMHAKIDHVLKAQAHFIHHHPDIPNEHSDGTTLSVVPDGLLGRHVDHDDASAP
jgi:hypothetical protein